MSRTKLVWILSGMALMDLLIPVPVFALAAIYIVVKRPVSFLDFIRRIYAAK